MNFKFLLAGSTALMMFQTNLCAKSVQVETDLPSNETDWIASADLKNGCIEEKKNQKSCCPSQNGQTTTKKNQNVRYYLQGEPMDCRYQPTFNAPATIDVKNCGEDFFASASFLYWYGGEDGLTLATNAILSGSNVYSSTNTATLFQSFDYKPGFKVGFGYTVDHDWTLFAEYTWLRGTNIVRHSAPTQPTLTVGSSTVLSGTPVLATTDWFQLGTSAGQALVGSHLSSKWEYGLDFVDAVASRPFYQGRRLIVSPYAGLRAAWIRQSMTVELTEASGLFGGAFGAGSSPQQPIRSHTKSTSWAIGPRVGVESSCLLPMGFRVEGGIATNLLYTNYDVRHSEDRASTQFNTQSYRSKWNDYRTLRAIAECGLGFGWGSYLFDERFHIDFSADYDFTYLWGQNMIRKMLDDLLTGTSSASEALYFHGLTLTGRFDF